MSNNSTPKLTETQTLIRVVGLSSLCISLAIIAHGLLVFATSL